jgi:hypothetical protein
MHVPALSVFIDISLRVAIAKQDPNHYAFRPVVKSGDYEDLCPASLCDPTTSLGNSIVHRRAIFREVFNCYGETCYLRKLLRPVMDLCYKGRGSYCEYYWNSSAIAPSAIKVMLDGKEISDPLSIASLAAKFRARSLSSNELSKFVARKPKKSKLKRVSKKASAIQEEINMPMAA